ncbi:hypothetical protein SCP_0605260 [Sparassis crispa]|uniref:Uncharacterized protein n=1 Tax=Sparassis crispa TaxID=139825 RepID=A0A401GQP6_9APHY|nr:hypothetical protein SCP_0605260 [Sparassis crispa]GBE84547.1 hypothetical protein SCP_0605260 [Sparassis crispa]
MQLDPTSLECPDYASDMYAVTRAPLVNDNTSNEQAIQLLVNIWKAGNEADKVAWQLQIEEHEAEIAEQIRLAAEADKDTQEAQLVEQANAQKEETKKNRAKFAPIPDRDVPTVAPVIAANYAVKRMEKGNFVELWYYTNEGLEEALRITSSVDDEAMVITRTADGSTSWVPAASVREARGVTDDKDIHWEDFCQAVLRMVLAMEQARWPEEWITMLARFWGNLQIHELRSSIDPLDQKTLLVYQGEQHKLWHRAITSSATAYNLAQINKELIRKTKERIYWAERGRRDNERDFSVRTSTIWWQMTC